jgi:hypothetical protein
VCCLMRTSANIQAHSHDDGASKWCAESGVDPRTPLPWTSQKAGGLDVADLTK